MSLLVSYLPKGSTEDPLVVDLVFSKSYDDVVKSACEMFKHQLPPEDQIIDRKLARYVKMASGSRWVTLHPDRYAQLVEAGPVDDLELRLEIAVSTPRNEVSDHLSRSPSTLEIPLPHSPPESIGGLNPGRHPTIVSIEPGAGIEAPLNSAVDVPMTPDSVFKSVLARTKSTRPLSPIIAKSPVENKKDNPTVLFNNAIASFMAGRYPEARTQFELAAKRFHEKLDPRQEADCLRHLGATCRFLQEYDTARTHLSNARKIYESLGSACRQEQLRCDRHLARVEEDSGNNQAALVKYQELIRTSQQEGMLTQEAWCTYYLGHLYNGMKHHDKALSLLAEAVKMAQKIENPEIEAFATEDMGYCAERQGHPQLAMECYEKALGQFKTGGGGKWVAHENRVKTRMDQLRRGFPSLLSPVARPSGWSIERFVVRSFTR